MLFAATQMQIFFLYPKQGNLKKNADLDGAEKGKKAKKVLENGNIWSLDALSADKRMQKERIDDHMAP